MTTPETICPGCGRPFKGERGLRVHQSHPFTTAACRPAMATVSADSGARDKAAVNELQAWATEHESFVVWGTHDIDLAVPTLQGFLRENYTAEEADELLPDRKDFCNGGYYWGRPGLPEEETWVETDYSFEAVDGWVPYLVVIQ